MRVVKTRPQTPLKSGALSGGSQGLELGGELALVAGHGVLVHDVLVGDAISHADGVANDGVSHSLVTSGNGFAGRLQGGAQLGAQGRRPLGGEEVRVL